MTYLLDVNVLLALHYKEHIHHERAARWVQCLRTKDREPPVLATCAIAELGFVRIATSRAAT